ncbi:putative acetyltransferase [Herbihabitans rhizosphaerae]|uniref:Putative acetyltransferase n=1 Tax=Herbihabitans rhizosphaerae TaxID=1872711 RepID=A0A4V2EUI4_9PSEU|nr:GNAT family N-acetyltransferase [Herbihabitans rhizosphaerae]RZS44683.1 putative acetyltransferase [Herbihabitans rhizosphaerae]
MIVRPVRADEAEAAYRLRRLGFGGSRDPAVTDLEEPKGRVTLVAEDGGRLPGALSIWDYRQFFGGRPVPMGGVASVAVEPSARGRGVASAMVDAALPVMREAGQCVSALYPSAPPLYRSRGWEQAGAQTSVILETRLLATVPRPSTALDVRPAERSDLDALHAAYLRVASTVDGMLDRASAPFRVDRVLEFDVVTVVERDGELSGYLTAERPDGDELIVRDLIADDADTARLLLRQLGSWAGLLDTVRLRMVDPLVDGLLLDLPTHHQVEAHPWMLRVVDLPAAIAARGWPLAGGLRPSTVDIEVVDEHAPWQAGRHRITVEGDAVRCEGGGSGAVRLHARALGAWFAGATDTATLRRAGLLDGDVNAATVLDALTGAPRAPRMADAF